MAGVVAPEGSFSPAAVISLSAPSNLMGGAESAGVRWGIPGRRCRHAHLTLPAL